MFIGNIPPEVIGDVIGGGGTAMIAKGRFEFTAENDPTHIHVVNFASFSAGEFGEWDRLVLDLHYFPLSDDPSGNPFQFSLWEQNQFLDDASMLFENFDASAPVGNADITLAHYITAVIQPARHYSVAAIGSDDGTKGLQCDMYHRWFTLVEISNANWSDSYSPRMYDQALDLRFRISKPNALTGGGADDTAFVWRLFHIKQSD